MTVTPDPRAFPAPGSAAKGAPPPLKRALTPADGAADVAAPSRAGVDSVLHQSNSSSRGAARPGGLHLAVAMAGVALGLEIAQMISRRRNS